MEEIVDFSAYPVIRIDQISLLSQPKLIQAIDDVKLILSEQSNREKSALHGYLQKQLLLMQKELDRKEAEERVALVLMGLSPCGPSGMEIGTAHKGSWSNLPLNMTQPVSYGKERQKKENDNIAIKNEDIAVLVSRSAPNTPFSAVEVNETNHSSTAVEKTGGVANSSVTSSGALEGGAPIKQRTEKISDERSNSKIRKGGTVSVTKVLSSSNISFNNVPAVGAAMDVVNKNFGSMFIVAATEKKKRFAVPKKVSQESTEDMKKKEKLERRRQAMQRLLKRQEERKEYHAQVRRLKEEKKRKMSANLQREGGKLVACASTEVVGKQATTVSSSRRTSVRSDYSSDAESISGGDDDHGIVIDQKIVESIVAAKDSTEQPPSARSITSAGSSHHESYGPLSTHGKIPAEEEIAVDGKEPADENRAAPLSVHTPGTGELPRTMTAPEVVSDHPSAQILDDLIEEKTTAALSSLRRLKEKKRDSKMNSTALPVHPSEEPSVVPPVSDGDTRRPSVQIVERVTFGLLVYTFNVFHAVVHPLEAWARVTYPAEDWAVDLDRLHQSRNVQMSNDRPSGDYLASGEVLVSQLGLVLLIKFILHSLLPSDFRDSSEFLADWNRCIAMFDESIDLFLSYVDFGNMFSSKPSAAVATKPAAVNAILSREVNVCANLYRYCQQLKSILVHKNVGNAAGGYRFILSFLADSVECPNRVESRVDGSAKEDEGVGTSNQSIPIPQLTPPSTELGGSILDFEQPQENRNDFVEPVHQGSGGIGAQNFNDDDNGDDGGDLGCSDEESIMPVYDNQIIPVNSQTAHAGDNNLQRDECIPIPPVLVTKERRPKLSDTYSNIGMIFPVAYNQFGLFKQHGGDTSVLAKALLESMHVQAKVYDEWMEVMSDYSTVFCEDREIRENIDNQSDNGSAMVYKGGSRCLHYRVKSPRIEVSNIIKDVFETSNYLKDSWVELPTGLGLGVSWNILWTWSKPKINMTHLLVWQKVNHFQDSKQLTRKDLLKKNIQRFIGLSTIGMLEFDIMPQTFILPHEYTQFVQSFTQLQSTAAASTEGHGFHYWIMKPVGLSRGRGIILIKDLSDLTYSQESVVQRYVERPLCLDGYKFDLRLYIVVTSFQPLEAFIYRDGFARVSTAAYSLDPETMSNKFIHLTNSSIQKQNASGPSGDNPLMKHCDDPDDDAGGSKISLQGPHGLWARLLAKGIDTEALWTSICNVVIKSLVVVDDKMSYQPCCFELFGYDILIDSDLKPWLLEVNASPSLGRENKLDVRVKNAMIADIIRLVDPAPYDRAALARVLKRRLNNMAKSRFSFLSKNDGDLERDLKEILGENYHPRPYGQMPAYLGNYEMICPNTKSYERLLKLKKKMFKSN